MRSEKDLVCIRSPSRAAEIYPRCVSQARPLLFRSSVTLAGPRQAAYVFPTHTGCLLASPLPPNCGTCPVVSFRRLLLGPLARYYSN